MLHLRDLFFHSEYKDIAPSKPLCVIGDIHGRLDLLNKLLDRIDGETELIFVGDYLDRGPQSAQVIDRLIGLKSQGRATCLMGNHEAMFLGFVDAPERGGAWLRSGGCATLDSYGVRPISEWAGLAERQAAHRDLLSNLPMDHLAFLFSLEPGYLSGNVLVSHAGADPKSPIDAQDWNSLVWGQSGFSDTRRDDESWVVHGHTIQDQPIASEGRVSLDTGAWKTGHLTAAMIEPGKVRFIST